MALSFNIFCFLQFIVYGQSNNKHQSKYYQSWCETNAKSPGHCLYLDDTGCNKFFPQTYDRDFMCPNRFEQSYLTGYNPTAPFGTASVNTTAFKNLVNPNFHISVILIRRNQTGYPFYKYFGNQQSNVYQPWSSSKPFAIINAASTQRTTCKNFGLNSYEDNKDDELGDMSTIIHSYGANPQNMESNCLAYYMLNIGGRQKLDDNIHSEWLGGSSSDSLGGNYGCSNTYDLGMKFTEIGNKTNECSMPTTKMVSITNSLSAIAESEMYKRIIMIREESQWAYPNSKWEDVKQLMYGPMNSTMFPGILWGGGSTDTAWYIQSCLKNITQIDENTKGEWRILSKLGAGNSDIVHNSYTCLPVYNGDNVIVNNGVEFVITMRHTMSGESLCTTDKYIQQNIQPVIQGIMDGSIS